MYRMMKAIALTLFVTLLSTSAYAETFNCQNGLYWSDSGEIVIVATINEDGYTGKIKVAGTTQSTSYEVVGVNRRWDWPTKGQKYLYAFVIKPDNGAYFLDFTMADENGISKATQFFNCRPAG